MFLPLLFAIFTVGFMLFAQGAIDVIPLATYFQKQLAVLCIAGMIWAALAGFALNQRQTHVAGL